MTKGPTGVRPPVHTPVSPLSEDNQPGKPLSDKTSPKPKIARGRNRTAGKSLSSRRTQQTGPRQSISRKAHEFSRAQQQYRVEQALVADLLGQKHIIDLLPDIEHYLAHPETATDDLPFELTYSDANQVIQFVPPDETAQALIPLLKQHIQPVLANLKRTATPAHTQALEQQLTVAQNRLKASEHQLQQFQPDFRPVQVQPGSVELELASPLSQTVPSPGKPRVRFDPVSAPLSPQEKKELQSRDWIQFMQSPDHRIEGQQWTLNQVRAFNDQQMEKEHNYIQLLFPNKIPSSVNPGAPILTPRMAARLRDDPAMERQLLVSVDHVLRFWGIERAGDDVGLMVGETGRHSKWCANDNNHNQKRVTRMLHCLMACGQQELARNIEKALQAHRRQLKAPPNRYWSDAVGRTKTAPVRKVAVPKTNVSKSPVVPWQDYQRRFPFNQFKDRPGVVQFYNKDEKYYELTNFYDCGSLTIDGIAWPSTEHYFQACKFAPGSPEWNHIRTRKNSSEVFHFIHPYKDKSQSIPLNVTREQWDGGAKDRVMLKALRAKAQQNPQFRKTLLSTANKPLFETSPYDGYWGVKYNRGDHGKNVLGAMLMQVRDEIRAGKLPPR
ncbi:NADAR domain-containing protein [Spongorhabdus nitratireducens]